MMKRNYKGLIFLLLYSFCVWAGFSQPDINTTGQGGVRGIAIGVPLVLIMWATLTVYFSQKNKDTWRQTADKLKHNIGGLIGFNVYGKKRKK